MSKETLAECKLVDMLNDELKEYLGGTYQKLKDLEEAKKKDPEIIQLQERLKTYMHDQYNIKIKQLKAQLKAARSVAKVKGVEWRLPKDSE